MSSGGALDHKLNQDYNLQSPQYSILTKKLLQVHHPEEYVEIIHVLSKLEE